MWFELLDVCQQLLQMLFFNQFILNAGSFINNLVKMFLVMTGRLGTDGGFLFPDLVYVDIFGNGDQPGTERVIFVKSVNFIKSP